METKEKLIEIEKHFKRKQQAAQAAGVTLTSWGRWKKGSIRLDPKNPRHAKSLAVIDLLYHQVTGSHS